MDVATEKRFIDACHHAKAIVGMMPKLPEGLTPRHIHALDVIFQLQDEQSAVRVSDVATAMNSTRPSITRIVSELEAAGLLTKTRNENDRRVQEIAPTELGREMYQELVVDYHTHLAELFSAISEKDMTCATRVIEEAYDLMCEDRKRG